MRKRFWTSAGVVCALALGGLTLVGCDDDKPPCIKSHTEDRPMLVGKIFIVQPVTICDKRAQPTTKPK